MLNHLKKILTRKRKKPGKQGGDQDVIQTSTASAIILLEAAHADDECTQEEMDHIAATIKSTLKLSSDCTAELIALAHETREYEVDLWQFTNQINNDFSHAEKIQVIENVWEIIFLDGHLEQHEDHFVHKLANLLRLEHKELIDAKMKVKQKNEGV